MKSKKRYPTVLEIVRAAGGPTKIAKSFDPEIKRQSVGIWIKTGRVPASRVCVVSALSGFTCHEIRPDVFHTDSNPPWIKPAIGKTLT